MSVQFVHLGLILGFGFVIANSAVVPRAVQYYQIADLDGNVLTAHAGPPPDGHTYPAAGNVTLEKFDANISAQRWAIHDSFEERKHIISEEHSWNVVKVYFICPSCFPVDNDWTVETGADGTSIISTTFILDNKISCILHNGLGNQISFGPCDRTPGSSSHWKIVPIVIRNN